MLRFIFILFATGLLVAIPIVLFGRIVPTQEKSTLNTRDAILAKQETARGLRPDGILDRFGGWVGYAPASARVQASDETVGLGASEAGEASNSAAERFADKAFYDDFSAIAVIEEVSDITDSSSPHWWVSAGGHMLMGSGMAETMQGTRKEGDVWQQKYAQGEQADVTDNGAHPQNAFRVVQRGLWGNIQHDVYFRIARIIESEHEQRDAANGVFLMSRYVDSENLYYSGIRVDGTIVIKKKQDGAYHTLFTKKLYDGAYDRDSAASLLPLDKWIGIRTIVENTLDGRVDIAVAIDRDRKGNWEIVGSTTDDGATYGGAPFTNDGYTGIRSDFMDVQFEDYTVEKKE